MNEHYSRQNGHRLRSEYHKTQQKVREENPEHFMRFLPSEGVIFQAPDQYTQFALYQWGQELVETHDRLDNTPMQYQERAREDINRIHEIIEELRGL